jgi:hypothetical protein
MFTIVEDGDPAQSTTWYVLAGTGEHRGCYRTLDAAVRFAAHFTYLAQEEERRAPIPNADPRYITEAYRRGQAAAYKHAAMRLSFLLGGTLTPKGKVTQAHILRVALDEWSQENLDIANEHSLAIQEQRPVRPVPPRPRA